MTYYSVGRFIIFFPLQASNIIHEKKEESEGGSGLRRSTRPPHAVRIREESERGSTPEQRVSRERTSKVSEEQHEQLPHR